MGSDMGRWHWNPQVGEEGAGEGSAHEHRGEERGKRRFLLA